MSVMLMATVAVDVNGYHKASVLALQLEERPDQLRRASDRALLALHPLAVRHMSAAGVPQVGTRSRGSLGESKTSKQGA